MELHTNYEDLYEKKDKLEATIKKLKKDNIQVIVHMPFRNPKGDRFSLDSDNCNSFLKMLDTLGKLCVKYDVKAVVHPQP